MIVERLQIGEFFTFRELDVEFANGLTVFVGPNGAGKTTLGLEALAWTLWGKTARGSAPSAGNVAVTFRQGPGKHNEWTARRVRSRKEKKLVFGGEARGDLAAQTDTETQERIEDVVGDWNRFACTRVFSKGLLARFGAATDKERKLLLEGVLGLERFERAYEAARRRLLKVLSEESAARAEADKATALLEQARAQVASVEASRPARPSAELLAEAAMCDSLLPDLEQAASDADVAVTELRLKKEASAKALNTMIGEVNALARQIVATRAALANDGAPCPSCGRPIDAKLDRGHAEAEIAKVEAKRAEGSKKVAALQNRSKTFADHLARAEQTARDLRQKLNAARTEAASLRQAAGVAAGWEGMYQRAIEGKLGMEAHAEEALDALNSALAAVELHEEVVQVLGPKGVRGRMLEGALYAIETAANEVLPKMGLDLRVQLSGSRQRANGDEVAEVNLEVIGAGDGEYRGASDGERARLDIALLLALARTSKDEGLMVFDEVFDSLDDVGLEGVSDLLTELARTRQVFVVTHNPRFLALMPACPVVRVEKGAGGVSRIAGADLAPAPAAPAKKRAPRAARAT